MTLLFSFIVITPTEVSVYSGIPTYIYKPAVNLGSQHVRIYACTDFGTRQIVSRYIRAGVYVFPIIAAEIKNEELNCSVSQDSRYQVCNITTD